MIATAGEQGSCLMATAGEQGSCQVNCNKISSGTEFFLAPGTLMLTASYVLL